MTVECGGTHWLGMAMLLLLVPLGARAFPQRVVTTNLVLEPGAVLDSCLVIGASDICIEGNGAILRGPGVPGDLASFQGVGIRSEGHSRVVIRNLVVRGFQVGLDVTDGEGWLIEGCDFSDNYHDPEFGWGEGPRAGGIALTRVRQSRIVGNTCCRVWNACDLRESHDNEIARNTFSHASNTCLKLWHSCRNRIIRNDLSWGLRIKPGEVHARDSAGVLIESGSDDNYFEGNDITHGGDGIFIRVLNGWVSTGNVFVENDCSWANNNCIESWAPGNTFIRNKANHGSYGFWMGGSDKSVLIENEAAYNGLPTGFHNAPEPGFGHGGIVFVNGTSSHTKVIGNSCHHNNGGGIVLRGDLPSRGEAWKAYHWLITDNRLEANRWGIYAQFADLVFLARNVSLDNEQEDFFEAVTRVISPEPSSQPQPSAALRAPWLARVGDVVVLDASASGGSPERFMWDVGSTSLEGPRVSHRFTTPGVYRVALTVSSGDRADIAGTEIYVVDPREASATEGNAAAWSARAEAGGRVRLCDDPQVALLGSSVRLDAEAHQGRPVEALVPVSLVGSLSERATLTVWMKWRSHNVFSFAEPTPLVRLSSPSGSLTLRPRSGNLLSDQGGRASEARWGWVLLRIPLAGDEEWERTEEGEVGHPLSLSFTFWPEGGEPFTVWMDGMRVD